MPDSSLWAPLKNDVVELLTDSVGDLIDIGSDEAKNLIDAVAEEGARQAWLLVNGNDAERAQAPGNLRSLKAHVIIDAADAVIVGSKELRTAFVKAVEVVGLFLLKNAPKLLAAL
jgi:hypothetical protein